MKTKHLYIALLDRIKNSIRINASVEVLLFNIRIINYLADKKGTVYYIYLL
jgi:hypothetical protein